MPQTLTATSEVNGLVDVHTFQDLSTLIGTRLASVDTSNPAGLSLTDKFNSVKDEVTVDALASFIKAQETLPGASSINQADVTATQKTNGTRDMTTLAQVARFIMVDNDLPEE